VCKTPTYRKSETGPARPAGARTARVIRLGAALAGSAVLVFGAGLACEPHALREEPVLLFSANNGGIIAACGCPGNPSGGFAKRQGLIEQYRRTCRNVLLVDPGDLLPDHKNETLVKYLGRGAARAKYDAIGLGDQEFLVGAERLRSLRAEYDLPMVCANVRDASGEFVVAPHLICSLNDRKVGIFAVIADRVYGFPPMEWRRGLVVEDPIVAAKREAEALAECDLVVALSHQPLHETRRLAAEVAGVDIFVSGHDTTTLLEPEKIGEAILVGAGQAGDILGALTLHHDAEGRPEWKQTLTELSARVPGAKWVEDLYWDYVKEAKEKPETDWDTPIPVVYEPAEACGKCHEPEFKQWQTTAHARAYEPIRKAGRQDDPECLMCHTMGFARKGGFESMAKTPALGRVTCQACHVVNSDHHEKGKKAEPRIFLSSRWCMSCHGMVQSPKFDYFTYEPRIRHRSEEDRKKD